MLTWLNVTVARVVAVFSKRRLDRDLEQEMASHLAMLTEDNVRRGMTLAKAEREARMELGRPESIKEQHRAMRGLPFFDTLMQDLRFTARTLRRDARFAVFAMCTVALGIGASSTIFSVLNALVFRPLPFHDAGRLVWIANLPDAGGIGEWRLQVNHFIDLRRDSKSFSDLAGYNAFFGTGDYKLTGDGEPERLSGVSVTENFFAFLGVRPLLGRTFNAAECQWNGPRAVLVGHRFWRSRFASDTGIVGRSLMLNDAPVTVVGVLPESFDFSTVFAPASRIDLYLPFPLTAETNRRGNILATMGRLNPGVTLESARSEFGILGARLTREHPERNDVRPKLIPLGNHVNGRLRPALFFLALAVGVVMLLVCANLSNLLLARTTARQKEMAIRAALGAGRGRLIRQMLTESMVLSLSGAVLGLGLAMAGTRMVARLDSFNIPLLESVQIDAASLIFTLLAGLLTGLVFGIVPAFQAPAMVHESLKDSSRGSSQGKGHTWLRSVLVIAELSLACVLLVSAGLVMRSFLHILDVDLGFQPERAVAVRVDPGRGYSTQAMRNAYFDEMLRKARAVPGMQAAGLTDVLPLGGDRSWGVRGKGQQYERGHLPETSVRVVSDGYLQALGIPLKAGRDFAASDSASSQPVIIINETLARTLWPNQNPLGQVVDQDGGRQVVGVVGDVRHRALEQATDCEMYLPIRQFTGYSSVDLVVRSALPSNVLVSAVRAELRSIDPWLPSSEFRPLQELVDKAVSPRRFIVTLLSGFSLFALVLACLGIYAVISYSVAQRSQELGIRMALGASSRDLQARIVLQTLRLAGVGIALGICASLLMSGALRSLLFGITSTDPATYAGIGAALMVVALIAGYLPARRAVRIDPMAALRTD